MAMPVRSARTTEFGEKAPTPVSIGPGSYLGLTGVVKARPSLAAFASSQHRSWQETPSMPAGPGPGSYGGPIGVSPVDHDARPSCCFESRAPRLAPQYTGSTAFGTSTVVHVPGPGSYETCAAPGQFVHREHFRGASRQKTAVGVDKRFNPPSVPRKEQSFGYNVDPRGKLLALSAPATMRTGDRADSPGPGDYNPDGNHWWAKASAAKFSKGARKTVFDAEPATKEFHPGPGEYNPNLKPRYQLDMPGSSAFMSGVPKGDIPPQAGPGPGQYMCQNASSMNTSTTNVQGFGSPAHRGAWLRSDQCPFSEPETDNVPGPGAYCSIQDNSSFHKVIPKTLTDEKIAFSSTGTRTSPGPAPQAAEVPGPGEYDLHTQSIAGELASRRRCGSKDAFGSCGDRFRTRNRNKTNDNMTPMQLWDQGRKLRRVVVLRATPKSTSCFKSGTGRFRAKSASDASAPQSTTSYVMKDTFDRIVERGARSKSKPFSSTSDRREGGAFEVRESSRMPGPGAYNIFNRKAPVPPPRSRAQTTSRFPQGARFGTIKSQNSVGPGSHEIAGSLIKKTFNITFGGASIPAGAGRVVHQACHARTSGSFSNSHFAGGASPVPLSANSSVVQPLGATEVRPAPAACNVIVAP